MKPKLKPPGSKRLKLQCDDLLSNFAFKFNLRRYIEVPSFQAPDEALVVLMASPASLNSTSLPPTAPAAGFTRIWADSGSRARKNPEGTMAVWRPVAPSGYVAVGCVVTPNHRAPEAWAAACVRADLTQPSAPAPAPLWQAGPAGYCPPRHPPHCSQYCPPRHHPHCRQYCPPRHHPHCKPSFIHLKCLT